MASSFLKFIQWYTLTVRPLCCEAVGAREFLLGNNIEGHRDKELSEQWSVKHQTQKKLQTSLQTSRDPFYVSQHFPFRV